MRKWIVILLCILTFLSNVAFADGGGSSLPLPSKYVVTTAFSMYKSNDKFIFYYPNKKQTMKEYFLIVADGKTIEVELSPSNPIGLAKVGAAEKITVYRKDRERVEISEQFKENYDNYKITVSDKAYYYYREYDASDVENSLPTKKELSEIDASIAIKLEEILGTNVSKENKNKAIAKLNLLSKDGTEITYKIYESKLVDNETQIRRSIEYIYENQSNIVEILNLDNRPLVATPYSYYSGPINRRKRMSNNDYISNNSDMGKIKKNDLPNSNFEQQKISINNIKMKQKVLKKNGVTMIDLDNIEKLGFKVNKKYRKNDLKIIMISNKINLVELRINDNKAYINCKRTYIIPPEIVGNKTYISIEILTNLGCSVMSDKNGIHIRRKGAVTYED